MSKQDMGGPAFPQARVWNAERAEYEDTQQYPGMTMWDYYAAAALAWLYASLQGPPQTSDNDLKALVREYMAERAAWLHETSECDWDHDLWICKYTVAQSMAEDLLFCVKRPDPKLSAEIVAERWQTWLAERKAQQAEEYARGEQAAQSLPEGVTA